jgi:hypothetical protein
VAEQGTETERTSSERPGPGRQRRRSLVTTALAVLLSFTLFGGVLSAWLEAEVFDAENFSDRAVQLLDSPDVRDALADEITEALVQNGPSQIASFQSVIRPVMADLLATPALKSIFRDAVRQAHEALFTQDGSAALVNLSQALAVLAGSMSISNPDVASNIPTGTDQLIVDFSDHIRAMELWQTAEELDQAAETLFVVSFALALAVVFLRGDVRRGIFKVGVAAVASGLLIVGLTVVVPRIASAFIADDQLAAAARSASEIFLGDLQVLGVWVVGYGVIGAALATAAAPRRAPVDVRDVWANLRTRWAAWQPSSPGGRITRAVVVIVVGLVLVIQRDAVVPIVLAVVGAYVTYLGVVMLLAVVGRTPSERMDDRIAEAASGDPTRSRLPALVACCAVLALLVTALGVTGTIWSRDRAAANDERRCNGFTELCDRPIDQVAFPASHNSMSASRDPGWLFAENTYGIPAQLEYGIRALLVKSHYGIAAGVGVGGTQLVVTDRAAEIAVNPTVAEAQLPPGSGERAAEMSKGVNIDPNRRDLYLCHVYCEYGATRMVTALTYIKQFLDQNPDEVIIFFVGDYISIADTEKAFRDAGLYDRLYSYDPTQPAPTLGAMIDARQNIFMLSEFSGTPPGWNNPGYGLFQDTPFTFTDASQLYVPGAGPNATTPVPTALVSDTTFAPDPAQTTGTTLAFGPDWTGVESCKPNRGAPDSPLFQINHWVTPAGAAPTVAQAKEVNAYDVLMPRVQACMGERGRFPTIIGVDFYDQGDLLKVVNDLNGVD